MKVAVAVTKYDGLDSEVAEHFGQCTKVAFARMQGNEVVIEKVIENDAGHGGCAAVGLIVPHGVTHAVMGQLGGGALSKFEQAGVKVVGFSGKLADAVRTIASGGISAPRSCAGHEHGHDHGGCHCGGH